MDGFIVEEDEDIVRKREDGDSLACSHVHTQHKRSRSGSDRNLDLTRGGVSQSVRKNFNESHVLPLSRISGARSPLHKNSTNTNSDATSTHQASLEKDIEQLQLHLQQEKSMRMMLERAMGRASSTLSPGHRHFSAQTKELIAEIELLEEEVSNREQRVLSLYRSIFEQRVSRPTSEQNSVMTSPAHTKNESRKHPSVISSAFCSSKNFPLRSFQALASISDSGRRKMLQSKTRQASFFGAKTNTCLEKTCSDHVKVHEKLEKVPGLRTLKDHLYQCPSKLSEEMVRCMAAVYCGLHGSDSANIEQNRSPLLSRSSTNVVLPRRCVRDNSDWSCRSLVEISSISADKNNISRPSYCFNNYRALVEQLEKVNVNQMETSAMTAFWINMYNSLVMHAYLAYGIPHSSLRRLALFHKCRLLTTSVAMS